jgi:hypothetical protein
MATSKGAFHVIFLLTLLTLYRVTGSFRGRSILVGSTQEAQGA